MPTKAVVFPEKSHGVIDGVFTRAWLDFFRGIWERVGGFADVITEKTAVSGVVWQFAGSTAPAGWLLCNGDAVSRAEYSALFGIIGTAYGAGDGTTTFNLPDLRGRAAIGAGSGAGLTTRALGNVGGAESHVLTQAELPDYALTVTDGGHTHTFTGTPHTHTVSDTGHTHDSANGNFVNDDTGTEYVGMAGGAGNTDAATASATTGVTIDNATAGGSNSTEFTGITVESGGGDTAFSTMPPFAVLNWIIKT